MMTSSLNLARDSIDDERFKFHANDDERFKFTGELHMMTSALKQIRGNGGTNYDRLMV